MIVAASAPGIVEQAIACSRPGADTLVRANLGQQNGSKYPAPTSVSASDNIRLLQRVGRLTEGVGALVFSGALPVEDLISHRLPLNQIRSGFDLALHPDELNR